MIQVKHATALLQSGRADEFSFYAEVSLAEEPSEDLLVNQRPPWDSSMSDLSVLDASDDADSLRSDSPDEKRPPPPPLPTLRTTTIDLNANNFHPPHVAISEDANANSSL